MLHDWVDLQMSSRADCADHTWQRGMLALCPTTRSEVLIRAQYSAISGQIWTLARPELFMIHHIS